MLKRHDSWLQTAGSQRGKKLQIQNHLNNITFYESFVKDYGSFYVLLVMIYLEIKGQFEGICFHPVPTEGYKRLQNLCYLGTRHKESAPGVPPEPLPPTILLKQMMLSR